MHYWRGGYYDFGGFDPRRAIEMSRLVDQSQVLDPLYNPSQMIDLSQGIDLSRTRGTNSSQPLPGPAIIGFYGLFEGDFLRGEPDPPPPPPRPRGLLLLGWKKKSWRPRVLGGGGSHARSGPQLLSFFGGK